MYCSSKGNLVLETFIENPVDGSVASPPDVVAVRSHKFQNGHQCRDGKSNKNSRVTFLAKRIAPKNGRKMTQNSPKITQNCP